MGCQYNDDESLEKGDFMKSSAAYPGTKPVNRTAANIVRKEDISFSQKELESILRLASPDERREAELWFAANRTALKRKR